MEKYIFGRLVRVSGSSEGWKIEVTKELRYSVQVCCDGFGEWENLQYCRTLREAGVVTENETRILAQGSADTDIVIRIIDRATGRERGLVNARRETVCIVTGYVGMRRIG